MLKPIIEIIKDSIDNIIYRGPVVIGIVETDNGDGSYDVFISESDKAYRNIFTLSRTPVIAVGDKVRILYEDGNKEKPIIWPPVAPSVLFEYCLATGATVFAYIYTNAWWRGQTFTTISKHTINYVELLLARRYLGSVPGIIYVEIRAATAGDMPTGPILTSGETNGNTLTYAIANPGVNREWRRIDLTEYNLENATKYVITLHLIGGSNINAAGIWTKSLNPYPSGKSIYSTTGGATWVALTYDSGFKVYGKAL